MAIEWVFWDFGGVLTGSPFDAFREYEFENNLPAGFIRQVNATNPHANAWAKLESSEIGLDEFDGLFAAESGALGHRLPGSDIIGLLAQDIRPAMVEALQIVKLHHRVACLTNNIKGAGEGPGMVLDKLKSRQVAEVMALFDFVLESSQLGARKPQPAFYRAALEKAEVSADRVLFLDDLGINLKPARALGMQTIKVLSEQQALADLSRVLSIQF